MILPLFMMNSKSLSIIYFDNFSCKLEKYFSKRNFDYNKEIITIENKLKNSPESVETHFIQKEGIPSIIDSERLWVILEAGNAINFGVLSFLEKYQKSSVSIIYLIPNLKFFSDFSLKTHKIVYNVLQEYARSGKLERFCIFDFKEIEKWFDNLSFMNYDDLVFDTISYILITDDYTKNTEPKYSTVKEVSDSARIETFSLIDINTNVERKCYNILIPREVIYNYIVDKEKLESSIFRKNIYDFLETKGTEETKFMFSLFEEQQQNICLGVQKSSMIQ